MSRWTVPDRARARERARDARAHVLRRLFERIGRHSVEVIREGQADTGGYVAAPTFEPYRYCSFREGSFTAEAMSRVGEAASASRFFDWGAHVILERRETLEGGGMLADRYTRDGLEQDEPTAYQLDGYGLWLWALKGHELRHGVGPEPWYNAAALLLDWLTATWRRPSCDWWDERETVNAATLACVAGGLAAWTRPEADDVRAELASLRNVRVDASVLVVGTPFDLLQPGSGVLETIERALVSPGGGVHRHLDDSYYGGGEWVPLTALLGWRYADLGRIDDAMGKLEWVAAQADVEDDLPEQSSAHLLVPEAQAVWTERWGPPASPLLWSHAMFLILAQRLGFV